ncbi:MAG: hypothetical protein JOY71_12050 [Acetobacteraceae bacterium]|nr:hypothetical protein [Acetobacteraceae bacterium]
MPMGLGALVDRTNELAFGAALRHELGSLAFAQRVLADLPTVSGLLARLREPPAAYDRRRGGVPRNAGLPGCDRGIPAENAKARPRHCLGLAWREPRVDRHSLDREMSAFGDSLMSLA